MTNYFNLIKVLVVAVLFQGTLKTAQALDDKREHVLDGTTINWTYTSSGSGMTLSFENGLAPYEWITGSRKGRSAQNIPYRSREISDGVYLINWVQPKRPDFITLIFNLNTNVMFSSGLIGYGTDRQRNLFLDGIVDSVNRR